jgi:hypothetical protein
MLGYAPNSVWMNLGFLTCFWIFYLFKLVLVVIMKCCKMPKGRCKGFYKSLTRNMFFTELFMITLEGFLEYLIAGVYQLRSSTSAEQPASNGFLIFVLIMSFFALLIFTYGVYSNQLLPDLSKFYMSFG